MIPLLKETGNQSFCEGHGTRYWEYSINGHFFGLKKNPKGLIIHYDNDLTNAKKFHVWVDRGFAPKQLDTDNFREAFNFLVTHTVKPYFRC